ncbi:unnamed protein product [Adineta ricciae]|uniref:IRG-type G domain-containing protein n=1 Tax=Adineta ricciae TaxID=249248 RepID=A0A816D783_ADIRI|nr:unnamed protein product [Adineta ricciae]
MKSIIVIAKILAVVGPAVGIGLLMAYNYFKKSAPRPASAPEEIIPQSEMIIRARKVLRMDCGIYYNIGICGSSGTGKSSFINCMRKIKDVKLTSEFRFQEDGPAPIGVSETTADCTRYSYPNNEAPYLRLWDIPGGGTAKHPAETYFADKLLYAFDCLIILYAGRFTKLDLDICKQAYIYKIPVLLVRSKADIDVDIQKTMKVDELDRSLTGKEYEQLIKETVDTLKHDVVQLLATVPGCNHLTNLPVYVVAPQRYRSPRSNECPPLEMEQMLERCLTVAASGRR